MTGTGFVLQNNGGNDLPVAQNDAYEFTQRLPDGAAYAVSVLTQPTGHRCTVQFPTGTIAGANVDDVAVACVPSYSVGGTVTGLKGTLGLSNEGGPARNVGADGDFTLPLGLVAGEAYDLTVAVQPLGQLCTITEGTETGTIGAANVATVEVLCRDLRIALNEVQARPGASFWGDSNADGVQNADQDEFVEIMNDEAFEVSLAGLTLRTGSAAAPAVKFTFPAGTTLAAGARAVVFGGGVPTGSFGGAQTFSAVLGLVNGPGAAFVVQLQAGAALTLGQLGWTGATLFACDGDDCASQTRNPETNGSPMAEHSTVAGAGVLASPGVAALDAVPKWLPAFGSPAPAPAPIGVNSRFRAQFNMTMNASELGTALTLFESSCAVKTNAVSASAASDVGGTAARIVPATALRYGQPYCLAVTGPLHGSAGATLDMTISSVDFVTRGPTSVPAGGVVISQIGGTFTANNEFVELYNASNADVDVSGWFVQRRSRGGSISCLATLPAGTVLPAHRYYLLGASGYVDATVAKDFPTMAGALTGTDESVLLLAGAPQCTTASPALATRRDAVSYGDLSDTYAGLFLPALVASGQIAAVRRKACYDSTGDASPTGIVAPGGHADKGSSEQTGASDADFVAVAAAPRNAATPAPTGVCAQ